MEVNQACREYLGHKTKDVVGKQFSEAFASIPGFEIQYQNLRDLRREITDGGGRTFEVMVKEFKFGRAATMGNMVVMHDITERKKMEEVLRKAEAQKKIAESERRYRMVVDNQTEAIVSFRPDGSVTFTNSVLEKSLDRMGIRVKDLNIFDHPNVWESKGLDKFIASISRTNPAGEFEQTINMPDGASRQLLWRAKGIFDGVGTLQEVQAVGIDITRMRQFEIELAKNQRLESLGVLAGGIAHDFNNMLVAIVNNTEIAMLDKTVDEKHVHRLQESVNSAMRAKKLTQQLLTFSKGGAPIKEDVNLISLIRSSVDFVLAGSQISVLYDIDEGLRKVSADPGQIEQVINNLVLNAVQAMPQGGRIYIMAGNFRNKDLDPDLVEEGPWVQIRITDEGVGIPKENLSRIFDPFYTTKDSGHGLGLSTVNSIVKNHGGNIKVESEVGKGTTMIVSLPALKEYSQSPWQMNQEVNVGQRGRILIMDDEEPILDVLADMLIGFGYQVGCVRCGEEAITSYREALSSGRPYDGMIMDLTIRGGMGGKEAIKGILSLDPKARVIVSSGYSNDPIMAHPHEYGFRDVLTKPFTMRDLSEKLLSVLNPEVEN
jgi:signal transduction histidine kinase/ActR/RegA family two-component response regulator